jgi:hypothetical protein
MKLLDYHSKLISFRRKRNILLTGIILLTLLLALASCKSNQTTGNGCIGGDPCARSAFIYGEVQNIPPQSIRNKYVVVAINPHNMCTDSDTLIFGQGGPDHAYATHFADSDTYRLAFPVLNFLYSSCIKAAIVSYAKNDFKHLSDYDTIWAGPQKVNFSKYQDSARVDFFFGDSTGG